MTNAELFRRTFGIYAEEFWSYTEKQMLDWINEDVPDKNVGDIISRQAALKALEFTWAGKAAFDAIMALPSVEQQRWIPVTVRKPDDSYRVIVTDFDYVEVSRWFDGRWYDIDGNTLKGVTAWMPLPKPYKGGVE